MVKMWLPNVALQRKNCLSYNRGYMKRLVLLSVFTVFIFTSCLMTFGDYPEYYEDYEWQEITQEEAFEHISSLDLSKQIHKKAKLQMYHPKNNKIYNDMKIEYNENIEYPEYSYYYIHIMSFEIRLSADLDDFRSTEDYPNPNAKYYTCPDDSSLIRVIGSHGWWDSMIYQNGWLVEGKKENPALKDYEYYYIKYKK